MNPKTPALKNGKYSFIYSTGRFGGKLQRIYGLKLMSHYYGEYYKDDKNILLTFDRIEVKEGKVCLANR